MKNFFLLIGLPLLTGCIASVAIPTQEAALKDACHGKDRVLASFSGAVVYRCGEGDQAKYAAYNAGSLYSELNEVDAIRAAAGIHCLSQGFKIGSTQHQVCQTETVRLTVPEAAGLRNSENAKAEIRRQRAADAMIAAGAAIAATAPQTTRLQTNCTSTQVGMFVNTSCY